MTQNQNNQPLEIRVVLHGEVKNRFHYIKRRKGLEANAEVLRLIINEYYEQLQREEAGC